MKGQEPVLGHCEVKAEFGILSLVLAEVTVRDKILTKEGASQVKRSSGPVLIIAKDKTEAGKASHA